MTTDPKKNQNPSDAACKGHDLHLCQLHRQEMHRKDPAAYAHLVRDPRYVCKNCGRVAAGQTSLCAPVMLGTWED